MNFLGRWLDLSDWFGELTVPPSAPPPPAFDHTPRTYLADDSVPLPASTYRTDQITEAVERLLALHKGG